MSAVDPIPPDHSFSQQIEILSVGKPSEQLSSAFTECCAEAQMLEHTLKSAIRSDIAVFANAADQTSFLDILEKVTLGQAKNIATGNPGMHKDIANCVGFFDCVKLQWAAASRPEADLAKNLKDAIDRRNRIAHQLLAEVHCSSVSIEEAVKFLDQSKQLFMELRHLIAIANGLSSRMGSVDTDGSSRPRFKTTA
jgi:hypothetical protein